MIIVVHVMFVRDSYAERIMNKWTAIMWVGIMFAFASCEAVVRYSNNQVSIAVVSCNQTTEQVEKDE